jgi:SET domain-containing protein 6
LSRYITAAAAVARFTAETSAEEMRDGLEGSDGDSDDEDDEDEDDYGPPPPMSDSEEEEDSEDDEEEEGDDSEEDKEEDEEGGGGELGLGEMSRSEMLSRLRWLRRRGTLADSKQRFSVSRTGRPSLALRHAARVLSMHPFQFRRLLAGKVRVLINRSTYQVKPFYLSSETVLPIK